ncbi:MAG TPA: hypothetical protein VLG69_02760 [Candidatus Andersenbacteria bacterium]|nr:hypothetical protein [Candidatus Andersenbacteria bacterium]
MNKVPKNAVIILSIIILAFGIYYFISHKPKINNIVSNSNQTNLAVNSRTFTADDQGGNLSFTYPVDLVATENSDGFITIKNSAGETVADLTAVTGSLEDNVNFIVNTTNKWFHTVPTKTQIKTNTNLTCTKLVGTFDSKVGSFNSHLNNSHLGQSGSVYVCEKPLVLDFYTNGNNALENNLKSILNTLK